MKTYSNLYPQVYNLGNLILAWRKARKGKTRKKYVLEFESEIERNLVVLHEELKSKMYIPRPLQSFVVRDPKTRRISKSDFRDRVVHHALVQILEPIFEKIFIYDSCANRKGKGTLFAVKRFDLFKKKVTNNGKIVSKSFKDKNFVKGYCLKADIKHYFDNVNHEILLGIIEKKIQDKDVLGLIEKILKNFDTPHSGKGMPLGNLTSQFFANIYLNELDYFVKHTLKAKYYLRYVDDFVLLDASYENLQIGGGGN